MLNVTAKVQKKTVPPNPGGAQVELRARAAGGVEPGVLTLRPAPKSDIFGVFAKFYRHARAKLGIFGVFAKFYRQRWAKLGILGVFAKFYRHARAKLGIFGVFAKFFVGGQ
ncbi:MAG: hypothetical protein II841_06230 [Bacteroidales bacterium]|nr:hypothetical protein [Bacteroidales bacterium]